MIQYFVDEKMNRVYIIQTGDSPTLEEAEEFALNLLEDIKNDR